MARRSDRRRRRASLSALASAALAASASSGEAAIIYHGVHGVGPNAMLPLPGNNQISVARLLTSRVGVSDTEHKTVPGPKGNARAVVGLGANTSFSTGVVNAGGVSFRRTHRVIALAKKGQTFRQVGSGTGYGAVGKFHDVSARRLASLYYFYGPRSLGYPRWTKHGYHSSASTFRRKVQARTSDHSFGRIDFYRTDQQTRYSFVGSGKEYALFRFGVGSQTDYGWLELDLGNAGGSAPFVRLLGYAYDNTGQPIPAGKIPEPKRLPLALGALALGAIGVREWRKKRNTAA